MRAQFFDGFDFATYKFSIVAIEEVDDFFNIEEFGLHPIMYNEACLRGYTAIFGFNDEKMLTLHKLLTNNNGMEPPAIDGIQLHRQILRPLRFPASPCFPKSLRADFRQGPVRQGPGPLPGSTRTAHRIRRTLEFQEEAPDQMG